MTLGSLCYRALNASGVTALARRLRTGGVVLCYHNVVPDSDSAGGGLGLHMPLADFERQMRWLAGTYDVVSLGELVGRLERGASCRGLAALTFDDAYRGVFDHAWPLLLTLRIPATVFVVAQAPERDDAFWWDHPNVLRDYSPDREEHWLTALQGEGASILASLAPAADAPGPITARRPATWEAITDAATAGLRLGAHSATHRSLPALDEAHLEREVAGSRELIGRRTGMTPEFFAYPYGLWNNRVRRTVRQAGYRAAFALHGGRHGDLWTLPRVNIPAGIEDGAFRAWVAGLDLRRRRRA